MRLPALFLSIMAPGLALAAPDLTGTWTMTAAYSLNPDGSRTESYGPAPRGMLTMDADGRYSVLIYHTVRKPFISADYGNATWQEYHDAVTTESTHFGRYSVDDGGKTLTFRIAAAHNAAWDNSVQKRPFELVGDELSWKVPPQPSGAIPVSVWKRVR